MDFMEALAMFEGAFHHTPEPTPAGREADPQAVIEFLLRKVDEQQAQLTEQQTKLSEQDAYAELLAQELEQVRGQLQVTREELDRQLADYEVMSQNALVTERELDELKQKAGTKPMIQLPFHTEQKLAKLGWGEGQSPDVERQAV